MNFFAQQLYCYFLESGKQLPPEVMEVLGKTLSGLNATDIEVYNGFVGPYQDKIREALRERFKQQGSPMREWSQQANPYYRPIVEELAAQALGMESAPRLPESLVKRDASREAQVRQAGKMRRLAIPRISYLWVIAAVVVIALLAGGGWLYLYVTAPSRALDRIRGEIERGEYSMAFQHIEEMEEKYPDKAQTEEAEDLKPQVALSHADELLAQASYEEAIRYYKEAGSGWELKKEAMLGCTNAYFAWAGVLNASGDNANSYECCESALANAPDDYDTTPIMDLRAQVLFSWGESLRGQQDYYGSAGRFEKCYREWPTGPLAGKALENYIDMSVAHHCNSAPPAKSVSAGGNVKVNLINPTDYAWTCFFSGPSTMCVDLAPHETKTIHILPGVYNEAFVIETLKLSYHMVAEDFTKPTGSYSWWDMPMPYPEDVAPQGVAYEQIMARIDELEASLPPEILECVETLEYQPLDGGGAMSDSMAEYSPSENTIYFDAPYIPADELDATIFHEWGHAYSDRYLDQEEEEEYREIRDIAEGIPWEDYDNYYLSLEEDFAETFAVVFGGAAWEGYSWYGPVVDAEALKEMILSAAD
jgi:tetratricopeptide (TPR) repeat protein